MKSALLLVLIGGISIGISGTQLYTNLKYTTFAIPKYKSGDCLDNGLFFEKVVDVRKSHVLKGAMYLTTAIHDGRKGRSGTVDTWIADEKYVQVNPTNCEVR